MAFTVWMVVQDNTTSNILSLHQITVFLSFMSTKVFVYFSEGSVLKKITG